MTERPIIFQGWGVRAIQQNLKTQTRRTKGLERINRNPNDWQFTNSENGYFLFSKWQDPLIEELLRCPFGVPGDRLWIRESFSTSALCVYPCPIAWYRADFDQFDNPAKDPEHTCPPEYRDKLSRKYANFADCFACAREREVPFRWQPSIHMPRRLARLLLEITEVRVQRLRQIGYNDVLSEGLNAADLRVLFGCDHQLTEEAWIAAYSLKWDAINGKDKYVKGAGFGGETARFESTVKWSDNPWVFAITFRRIEA